MKTFTSRSYGVHVPSIPGLYRDGREVDSSHRPPDSPPTSGRFRWVCMTSETAEAGGRCEENLLKYTALLAPSVLSGGGALPEDQSQAHRGSKGIEAKSSLLCLYSFQPRSRSWENGGNRYHSCGSLEIVCGASNTSSHPTGQDLSIPGKNEQLLFL